MSTHDYLVNLETKRNQISNTLISRGIKRSPSTNLGELTDCLSNLENPNAFPEKVYLKSGKIICDTLTTKIEIKNLPKEPKKLVLTRWGTRFEDIPVSNGDITLYGICQVTFELWKQTLIINDKTYNLSGNGTFLYSEGKSNATALTVLQSQKGTTAYNSLSYSDGTLKIDLMQLKTNTSGYIFLAGEYEWYAEFDDSEYFQITTDGIVSLKDEYKHGGASNSSLPESLVISNVVDGIKVTAYASNMFINNKRIKHLTLADGITTIPESFCHDAINLIRVDNTQDITTIGNNAFNRTSLLNVEFKNLTSVYENAFRRCCMLETANLGKIKSIPAGLFFGCHSLQKVVGLNNATGIGRGAFGYTQNLKSVDIDISKIAYVLPLAFAISGIDLEWGNAKEGCNFFPWSTSNHYWQNGTVTSTEKKPWVRENIIAHINPVPMSINQVNPQWSTRLIGGVDYCSGTSFEKRMQSICGAYEGWSEEDDWGATSGGWKVKPFTYEIGCHIFSVYQAYLGIYHPEKVWTNVVDIEIQIKKDYGDVFTKIVNDEELDLFIYSQSEKTIQPNTGVYAEKLAEKLGLTYTHLFEAANDRAFTEDDYNKFYNALATPDTYVRINVPTTDTRTGGHAVIAYGIDKEGNVLVTDTGGLHFFFGIYFDYKFKVPIQNLLMSGDCTMNKDTNDPTKYDPTKWTNNNVTTPFAIIQKKQLEAKNEVT